MTAIHLSSSELQNRFDQFIEDKAVQQAIHVWLLNRALIWHYHLKYPKKMPYLAVERFFEEQNNIFKNYLFVLMQKHAESEVKQLTILGCPSHNLPTAFNYPTSNLPPPFLEQKKIQSYGYYLITMIKNYVKEHEEDGNLILEMSNKVIFNEGNDSTYRVLSQYAISNYINKIFQSAIKKNKRIYSFSIQRLLLTSNNFFSVTMFFIPLILLGAFYCAGEENASWIATFLNFYLLSNSFWAHLIKNISGLIFLGYLLRSKIAIFSYSNEESLSHHHVYNQTQKFFLQESTRFQDLFFSHFFVFIILIGLAFFLYPIKENNWEIILPLWSSVLGMSFLLQRPVFSLLELEELLSLTAKNLTLIKVQSSTETNQDNLSHRLTSVPLDQKKLLERITQTITLSHIAQTFFCCNPNRIRHKIKKVKVETVTQNPAEKRNPKLKLWKAPPDAKQSLIPPELNDNLCMADIKIARDGQQEEKGVYFDPYLPTKYIAKDHLQKIKDNFKAKITKNGPGLRSLGTINIHGIQFGDKKIEVKSVVLWELKLGHDKELKNLRIIGIEYKNLIFLLDVTNKPFHSNDLSEYQMLLEKKSRTNNGFLKVNPPNSSPQSKMDFT